MNASQVQPTVEHESKTWCRWCKAARGVSSKAAKGSPTPPSNPGSALIPSQSPTSKLLIMKPATLMPSDVVQDDQLRLPDGMKNS